MTDDVVDGDLILTCPQCGRTFAKKRGLSAHIKYHDPEMRRRTSEAMRGHGVSEETRRKMSDSHKGRVESEETRRRKSEAQREVWNRPGYRETYSERNRGVRTQTEESNRRRSEAMKAYWADSENHNRHASRLGHGQNQDTKLKISRALSEANARPDVRERRSEAMRRRWAEIRGSDDEE